MSYLTTKNTGYRDCSFLSRSTQELRGWSSWVPAWFTARSKFSSNKPAKEAVMRVSTDALVLPSE